MGFLLIGDPHLDSKTPMSRRDNYREATLRKLDSLLKLAIDTAGVDMVVTTGDVFHRSDVPIPISYLNELAEKLKQFRDNNIEVRSIIGNHDIPHNNMNYFKNTPLNLLFQSGLIRPLGFKPYRIEEDNWVLYGLSYTEKSDRLKTIPKTDKKKILVMHYGTEKTVPADDVPVSELTDFDIVFAGHDHMYYPPLVGDGVTVYRPGSFTRRTKEEHNLSRPIIVYYVDDYGEVTELQLPDVEPASVIFKDQVFSRDPDTLYNNSYSSLFSDLSEDREYASIFDILNDLPPDVDDESVERILKYLSEQGIDAPDKKQKATKDESDVYEEAFSL